MAIQKVIWEEWQQKGTYLRDSADFFKYDLSKMSNEEIKSALNAFVSESYEKVADLNRLRTEISVYCKVELSKREV
jgi:hypothetical protein